MRTMTLIMATITSRHRAVTVLSRPRVSHTCRIYVPTLRYPGQGTATSTGTEGG
jgi:hypothetical protein